MNENQEWKRGEFLISTDHKKLDINIIHHFLTTETYWAADRSVEVVRRSFENSLPFVVYREEFQIRSYSN